MKKQWKVFKLKTTTDKSNQRIASDVGYTKKFDSLKEALNLSYTNFIRTTDEHHVKAAQEFWSRCDKNGDIYVSADKKGIYKISFIDFRN